MKIHILPFLLGLIVLFSNCSQREEVRAQFWNDDQNMVPKIIFDTDMGPDYDDVGALAVLHALASQGECEILATVASDAHLSIAPTIEGLNRYFGRDDLPVGAAENAPNFTAKNGWNDSLIHRFFTDIGNKPQYRSSVEVYRQVLAAQEDKSVTIVTVGFTSNLAQLLQSKGDDISPLSGRELVEQKVKGWVAMAGAFPQGREFNLFKDSTAALFSVAHWPSPILFSGFEIGVKIKTGRKIADAHGSNNPVGWAYQYNLDTYTKPERARSSWDQTAVLCAVRNPNDYFYINGPGQLLVDEKGHNKWDPDTDRQHYFLVHKYPYSVIETVIDDLINYSREFE